MQQMGNPKSPSVLIVEDESIVAQDIQQMRGIMPRSEIGIKLRQNCSTEALDAKALR